MRNSRQQSEKERSRAVSEIIGYVLVFSLIILTVGLVSISGLPTLDSARESEQIQNAERGFDVLNTNMAEVYERGAPSRATELNANDASVAMGEAVTFTVTTENSSGSTTATETRINPIVYSAGGDTSFVYSGGAVIREQADRSIMLRDPPFKFGDERTYITLVRTFSESTESIGGGTVLVRATSAGRSVEVQETRGSDIKQVNVTISDSSRLEMWQRYFEEEHGLDCTISGNLDCGTDVDANQTFVTLQEIKIELEI